MIFPKLGQTHLEMNGPLQETCVFQENTALSKPQTFKIETAQLDTTVPTSLQEPTTASVKLDTTAQVAAPRPSNMSADQESTVQRGQQKKLIAQSEPTQIVSEHLRDHTAEIAQLATTATKLVCTSMMMALLEVRSTVPLMG